MHHATDRIVLTTAVVIPVVAVMGTGTGLHWFITLEHEKKRERVRGWVGVLPVLAGTREYKQSHRSW